MPPAQGPPGIAAPGQRTVAHVNLNPSQLRRAYGGTGFTAYLWGTNSGLLPVDRENADALIPYVMILAKGEAHLLNADKKDQAGKCIAVANTLTACIGDQMDAESATARGYRQLIQFIKHEVAYAVDDVVSVSDRELIDQRPAIGWWPENRVLMRDIPDDQAVTHAEAVIAMEWLARKVRPLWLRGGAVIYTLGFVSLAKRGNISTGKLQKITGEIKQKTQLTFELTTEDVAICYSAVTSKISGADVAACFDHWVGLIGDSSLRMRLTLQQAAGAGLTSLACIRSAMQLFPTFDWNRIATLFPIEMEAVRQAMLAVGTNKYYGFQADLGPVRSTLYKSIGWVAKEMLIRHGGPTYNNIGGYAGWAGAVASQDELARMVNTYAPVAEDLAQIAGDRVRAVRELLDRTTGLDA
ncbi:nucleoprotein [Amblyomma dissimile mivirus]|nr:nucleoprotein [Amblyomma dissimile mivirus]